MANMLSEIIPEPPRKKSVVPDDDQPVTMYYAGDVAASQIGETGVSGKGTPGVRRGRASRAGTQVRGRGMWRRARKVGRQWCGVLCNTILREGRGRMQEGIAGAEMGAGTGIVMM